MKEIIRKGNNKEKGNLLGQTEIFMKETLFVAKWKDKEFINSMMGKFT